MAPRLRLSTVKMWRGYWEEGSDQKVEGEPPTKEEVPEEWGRRNPRRGHWSTLEKVTGRKDRHTVWAVMWHMSWLTLPMTLTSWRSSARSTAAATPFL